MLLKGGEKHTKELNVEVTRFHGFFLSLGKFCDDAQYSNLLLHASHADLDDLNL